MFESSLVASQQRSISSTQRWTAFASIGLQATAAAALIALPLLHPERLVPHTQAPRFVPAFKMPKPPIVKIQQTATTSSVTPSLPQSAATFTTPAHVPTLIHMGPDPGPAPAISSAASMSGGGYDPLTAVSNATAEPHIAVVPARPPQHIAVSQGVSEGMLLSPIRPVYPAIAKAAGVRGTVVVAAIISKTGTIESLHVLSGPLMLQSAAIEAIQAARYHPYKLNGEPTEVQTTITVNFRFDH